MFSHLAPLSFAIMKTPTYLIALALAIAGCTSWGNIEDMKWEIVLSTPTVSRGGDLVFHLKTIQLDGTQVKGVPFVWIVDWASVKGSRHKGESSYEMHLRCKGDRGQGELRIYVANQSNNLIEVCRSHFVIE